MKTVSLLPVLMIAVFLIGCENPVLVTCQEEKGILQGQLEQANAAISAKDSKIEALKAENIEIQKKTMEINMTIMEKQAEKDKQLKQKLIERAKQIKNLKEKVASLEKQIAEHKCPVAEAVVGTGEAAEETN
ncbi:MAG: hypothetical protein ACYSUG_01195 [Planctomycetota bacterium]|jgi:chromosome segregation ATPase